MQDNPFKIKRAYPPAGDPEAHLITTVVDTREGANLQRRALTSFVSQNLLGQEVLN